VIRRRRIFDIKITGLDELQRKLDEASQAFQALDGELATLRYNPNDPGSIEGAMREMEAAVDAKVAPYAGNALVESVAQRKSIALQFLRRRRRRA
jgi:hypothetical protein